MPREITSLKRRGDALRRSLQRRLTTAGRALAILGLIASGSMPFSAAPVEAACSGNAIVCENQNPGTPQSTWDVTGSGDPSIQGFATDISFNKGDTVNFKINTPATGYTITIYRLGYYQGNGARQIATVTPSVKLPQTQPACLTDAATGLIDCGNWAVSAAWTIPASAVSGVYIARLARTDTGGASHIPFVVRDDSSTSDLLFQTSDTTWQAYNQYGGTSLYMGNGPGGGSQAGRAYKVSYNRPFATRGQQSGYGTSDYLFYSEYPMIRWLELNGYNVSYTSGVDTERAGALIKNHRAFLSVGHDEYWSAGARTNVVAARDAGVNLAFFSGNEMYWKTRWENSIDASNTAYRTLVTYKESIANAPLDPQDPATWTGLWRDPRFSPPADGGQPENGVTGTIMMVNRGSAAISVPSTYSKLRLWRNTAAASLGAGQTLALGAQTLGYEWDVDMDNSTSTIAGPAARPAGLIDLSSTTVSNADVLLDYGSNTSGGTSTATHHLTLYRAPTGALVFGAGTIQWPFGLDVHHDADPDSGPTVPDTNMQQATVNLLADMGVQPQTLQSNLVAAIGSTDVAPPSSTITSPTNGASLAIGTPVTVSGTATDTGGGVVAGVEVSVDGGVSWHPASGTSNWTYSWTPSSGGTWSLLSRATDDSANLQTTPTRITVSVTGDTTAPTISNIAVSNITTNAATISWTTNEPATSQVQYGATTAYGSSTANDATLTLTHSQTIAGLSAGDTSNFRVLSQDQVGNQATSANGSFTTTVPASAIRLGDTHLETSQDSDSAGVAETFQYTASTTGNVTRLFVYLDSLNAASKVQVGLYADAANSPGNLLTSGTITSPQSAAWNGVSVPSVSITAGTKYWMAVLSPAGAGTLAIRDVPSGGGQSFVSSQTTLTALPSTFSTGTKYPNAPMSAYAADLSGTIINPPTVTMTGPANGATVSGTVAVSASATPASGATISSVQFLLDGAALGAPVTTAPYTVSWNTTGIANGSHTVSAQAGDSAGNVGTATAIAVTVSNVDSVPPVISNVASGSITASRATITWSTDKVASSQVDYGATTAYGTSTALDPTLVTSHSTTLPNLTPGTTYHYRVDSSNSSGFGASSSDNTFTTAAAPNCPCSIWGTTTTPTTPNSGDAQPIEVGLKFRADVDGYVTGVRFYKGASNTGTHVGNLWTSTGNLLSSATFSNETASGWQQVSFPTAVRISALTTYVVSYHTTTGNYSADSGFFSAAGVDNAPLHALANGADGLNGVYVYGAGAFPNQSFNATNYWVDAVFSATPPPPPPPTTISAVAANATSTSAATVTWTTSNPATSQVLYGTTTAYGNSTPTDFNMVTSHSQALSGLAPSTTYHYQVQSTDSTGAVVSSPDATFTTAAPVICPCTIWSSTATPTNPSANDAQAAELGVKFKSDVDGYIFGVRFYKSVANTGAHTGSLWSGTGTLLATGTFINESASGWQQLQFSAPVQVTANTTYLASYHTTAGHYAADANYFAVNGADSNPLHALANTKSPNGVYVYGASGFPTQTFGATNYWVDVIFNSTSTDQVPPVLTNPQAVGSSTSGETITWLTNKSSDSQVEYGTTTAYGSVSTVNSTMVTSHSVALTGLAPGTTYHYRVKSRDSAGNLGVSADSTFVTWAQNCPCSIWSSTNTPSVPSVNDPHAVEVGVRFRADINGLVRGIRFYKGATNTGTHTGHLWTNTGTLLATATFANETASGWQQVTFSSPVAITAGTTYVASYYTTSGNYAADSNFFATAGVDEGPLHALASGVDGPNGVYIYGAVSAFPNQSFNATNYWVDAVFTTN